MGKALKIGQGIFLGAVFCVLGRGCVRSLDKAYVKSKLENFQTIEGTVMDETFTFGRDDYYQVSIKISDGKKVLVYYDSNISGLYEPASLNTLFAKGDRVELEVAVNEDFDGDQRFVGISGKLIQKDLE